MGSGKTTVGALLAATLGRPLIDSDRQIEQRFGESGRILAERHGVAWLHQIEADVFESALAVERPAVIAPAASVVDRDDVIAALGDPALTVVLLDGDPEVLWRRAGAGHHRRPLALEQARSLARERTRRIRPVAALVVDVTTISAVEVAARVMRQLEE